MRRLIAFLIALLMTHTSGVFSTPNNESDGMISTAAIAEKTEDERYNPVKDMKVGATVTFGSYPQSQVTDSALIAKLDAVGKEWASYKYCQKSSDPSKGFIEYSDYMKYCDLTYLGTKYRAVTFTEYRPSVASDSPSDGRSFQDDNGYYVDTVYYFKFEPIRWKVLDPQEGYIMSEYVIDSQAFNNYLVNSDGSYYGDYDLTFYASNWENCSLRNWLNNSFYQDAFSETGKNMIGLTPLENKSTYTTDMYDGATTYDKIFVPSYYDVLNADYGFGTQASEQDSLRMASGTDYAKCQGLYVASTLSTLFRKPIWRLRTCDGSSVVWNVDNYGRTYNFFQIDNTSYGVRPALKFDPEPIKNTVTFDPVGGETEETSRLIITGQKIGNLPVPTREGCEFDGWFSALEGGYRVSEETIIDEDITFFAHWITFPVKLLLDSKPDKLNYAPGEEFDATGAKLRIEYSDSTYKDLPVEEAEIVGFDPSSGNATQKVYFSYVIDDITIKTEPFTIEIGTQVVALNIVSPPNKMNYVQGAHFDHTGLVAIATFSDNTTLDVTDSVTASGFDSASVGKETITLTYSRRGKVITAEFDIIMNAKLQSIAVTSLPDKLVYDAGESFSDEGLVVMATFADGTTKEVKDFAVSGFDKNQTGKQIITVTYNYGTQSRSSKFSVIVK